MLSDSVTKELCQVIRVFKNGKISFNSRQDSIRAGVSKIKQVLLDLCSSKGRQSEDKHKALDQFSQSRFDPDASIQYSDSLLQITTWKHKSTKCAVRGISGSAISAEKQNIYGAEDKEQDGLDAIENIAMKFKSIMKTRNWITI
jgi:hypothetical protein